MLTPLNFPDYPFRLRNENGKPWIFDAIRKKWLVLTPEEWVRQHWIYHLVNEKNYPASLLGIERSFELNKLRKRFDILVGHPPLILVECKAPSITISQAALHQALRYNLTLRVPWLILSNGLQHYVGNIRDEQLFFDRDLPDWDHR